MITTGTRRRKSTENVSSLHVRVRHVVIFSFFFSEGSDENESQCRRTIFQEEERGLTIRGPIPLKTYGRMGFLRVIHRQMLRYNMTPWRARFYPTR